MKYILIVEDDEKQFCDLAMDLCIYFGDQIRVLPLPNGEGYHSFRGLLGGLRLGEFGKIIDHYSNLTGNGGSKITIDFLVVDISLGDDDDDNIGLQFVKALKTSGESWAEIPVIVWSVFSGQESEASRLGAEYVYKKKGARDDFSIARGAVIERIEEILDLN